MYKCIFTEKRKKTLEIVIYPQNKIAPPQVKINPSSYYSPNNHIQALSFRNFPDTK